MAGVSERTTFQYLLTDKGNKAMRYTRGIAYIIRCLRINGVS